VLNSDAGDFVASSGFRKLMGLPPKHVVLVSRSLTVPALRARLSGLRISVLVRTWFRELKPVDARYSEFVGFKGSIGRGVGSQNGVEAVLKRGGRFG
jgi:hypothetical protein